jgi:DEAD/DEAH box helicase domain-containing protein
LGSKKPAKPFGAPASDAEDEDDDNEGDEAGPSDEERAASPEKESEEKKKTRLQRGEWKHTSFVVTCPMHL